MRKHYRFILAAPAVAGLLFYGAACDMEDDTAQTTPRETTPGEATPQTTPPAAGDRAEPAGGMQTPTGAAVSEAQVEQVTQAIEQARQTNEGLSARIEANTEIEAWGTGEQAKQRQTRVSELLDTVEAAVRQLGRADAKHGLIEKAKTDVTDPGLVLPVDIVERAALRSARPRKCRMSHARSQRAVEIDPWVDESWRTLIAMHRRAGDVIAVRRAEEGYRGMRRALGVD